jgi:hypothetical protein
MTTSRSSTVSCRVLGRLDGTRTRTGYLLDERVRPQAPDGAAVVTRLARASEAEVSARTEAARRRIDELNTPRLRHVGDDDFVAEDSDE